MFSTLEELVLNHVILFSKQKSFLIAGAKILQKYTKCNRLGLHKLHPYITHIGTPDNGKLLCIYHLNILEPLNV